VGDAGVEQVDGLDLCPSGSRLCLSSIRLAEGAQHLGPVDSAVAGDATDPTRLHGLDPLRGPGEVGDRQKCLSGPAEDHPGGDRAKLRSTV